MKTRFLCSICLVLLLVMQGCQGLSPVKQAKIPKPEYWPNEEWKTSTPEQQGMVSGKLVEMLQAVQSENIRLHSVLIIRNGYIVLEAYYPPYAPDIRHTIQSNTKSIIGALTGIAIDQGKIKDANQKLVDFFPERVIDNLDEHKKSIALSNLLSMTPGLDCEDNSASASGMYQTRVWVQYLLDLPMVFKPGEKWVYCSGAAHLLSAVLQQATGMDARSYANQVLFPKIGIANVDEKDWAADPQGVTNGIAALYLTPRELAKFGFLYLQKGQWDGQQVVSKQWVEASTREQAFIGKDPYVDGRDRRFGYMFSLFPEQKYYGYLGMAGQELYVIPEKNMVIVFTASLAVGKEARLLKLINEYILRSVQSDQPLPANEHGVNDIQDFLKANADERKSVEPLPQAALDISGKTYNLEQNSLAWQSMAFSFQPGSAEAWLKMDGKPPELKIGLDTSYRFTEMPGTRPVGLRGRWKSPNEFSMDYLILGEFIESVATIQFEADQIKVAITALNFSSQPQIIRGTLQK